MMSPDRITLSSASSFQQKTRFVQTYRQLPPGFIMTNKASNNLRALNEQIKSRGTDIIGRGLSDDY